MDRRENEHGGQAFLAQRLYGIEEGVESGLEGLDDAIIPVLWALGNQLPGVGREEVIVVAEVKPLRVPLGVVGRQPNGDVLSRLLRVARLLD